MRRTRLSGRLTTSRSRIYALLGAGLIAAFALASAAVASGSSRPANQVTITRDGSGIPHIVARNFTALGYGDGYAFAQDNLCTFANDIVTVEGQRSKYFGPSGTAVNYSAGVSSSNLDSDLYWHYVQSSGLIRSRADSEAAERAAPRGPPGIYRLRRRLQRVPEVRQAPRSGLQGQAVGTRDHAHRHDPARRADRHRGVRAAVRGRTRRRGAAGGDHRGERLPCATRVRPPARAGRAEAPVRRSGRPRAGFERDRPRRARHAFGPRHGAGQSPLPMAGDRALLDGAARRPRPLRRRGRDADGVPADRHRVQPQYRLDPHGLDDAAVCRLPAEPRPG